MRFAVIENGKVTNVIEAAADFRIDGAALVETASAGIGWTWDGKAFAPLAAPRRPVPEAVPLWKARAALAAAGLLNQVETVIASGSPVLQQFWEYASELRRDAPALTALAQALGLTDARVDDLFRAADSVAV